jgi:SUMO ligase MMS21 Smc5/6 complex component
MSRSTGYRSECDSRHIGPKAQNPRHKALKADRATAVISECVYTALTLLANNLMCLIDNHQPQTGHKNRAGIPH